MTLINKRVLFFLLSFIFITSAAQNNEINTIKLNYKQVLLSENKAEKPLLDQLLQLPPETVFSDQMVVELMERYPISKERINDLLSKIQEDGSWSDIDYANQNRSGWRSKVHVERILELAKVYKKTTSEFYLSPEVEKAIHNTLKYWFDNKPVSPNWWHNEIGVPKILGAVFILFEDKMSKPEKQAAIEVMKNSRFKMTGQNKVWLAGNVLVRGLLQNDFKLVKMARDTIASEIRTDQLEGIKADNSFHQHGAQQQFGNYGAAYISSMSLWAQLFNGTSIAFNQDQFNILSRLINGGYAWILWKGYMDINALGRQFFHQAQPHKAFTVGFTANAFAETDKTNSATYKRLLDDNFFHTTENTNLTGINHFWMSDYTIMRQPDWMASVKMSSNRVIGAEAGNGDNLKGYYLADGATYTYVDGDEYNNIFACWDWRKIPGITSYQTNAPLKQLSWKGYHNQSDFVGNVSDNITGMTAMDFKRDGITAKKLWIFTDKYMLCIGTDINSDSAHIVTTSIEQRIKKGDLYRLYGNYWRKAKRAMLDNNYKFYHDKTGYIILQESEGWLVTEKKTGAWKDIMAVYPSDFVEEKEVFSLWINHGRNPKEGTYQYAILPNTTMDEVKKFNIKDIKIISNTKDVQVVYLPKEDIFYIAAYEACDIQLSESIHFESKTPGLFMIKGKEIIASDPTQKLQTSQVIINKEVINIEFPAGEMKGTSVSYSR